MQSLAKRLAATMLPTFSRCTSPSLSPSPPPLLQHLCTSTTPTTTPTPTPSTIPPSNHRTQRPPQYELPYYGASDAVLNSLSDERTRAVLKLYGGLMRPHDTMDKLRERLRKVTRSWHRRDQLTIRGVVVSDKMVKSVVIATRRRCFNSKYQLHFFRTRRFMAHDETGLCREGDSVLIRSCRPLSKRKAHVVVVNFGDHMTPDDTDSRRIDLDSLKPTQ